MINLNDFSGKTALVTGAGDGIGEMLAKGLAGLGMTVAVLDIRLEAAERVVADIVGAGEAAFALSADVSDREAVFAAAEDLRARGSGLSLLWVNAGVGVGASLIDGKARAIDWAYGVNVLGAIWTVQAFVPLLRETEGVRHIGFTASSASLGAPEPPLTVYAATKQAVFAVAEGVRNEVAEEGIGTTILCPGLLNTDIWDGARARPDRFGGVRRMDPSIAGQWRAAKSPDLMWPHIEQAIARRGGYLVCTTDDATRTVYSDRVDAIASGFVDL